MLILINLLELSSNIIKALGIFGRLTKEQEDFFDTLENKYSKKEDGISRDIFRHLTLTFIQNATISDVRRQLDLLKQLKKFLPLKLQINKAFVKDEVTLPGQQHIALEFGLEQTQDLVTFVRNQAGDNTVATPYTKVVWFVPKENQQAVIDNLRNFNELIIADFYLASNKQNNENTIYTTNSFSKGNER